MFYDRLSGMRYWGGGRGEIMGADARVVTLKSHAKLTNTDTNRPSNHGKNDPQKKRGGGRVVGSFRGWGRRIENTRCYRCASCLTPL